MEPALRYTNIINSIVVLQAVATTRTFHRNTSHICLHSRIRSLQVLKQGRSTSEMRQSERPSYDHWAIRRRARLRILLTEAIPNMDIIFASTMHCTNHPCIRLATLWSITTTLVALRSCWIESGQQGHNHILLSYPECLRLGSKQ